MYLKNLNEWLEYHNLDEKYITYSDLKKANPKDIEQDAKREVLSVLPFSVTDEYKKQLISFKDMSDPEKGIKFEAKLKTGDKINIFKVSGYLPKLTTWEWYLNGKKKTKQNIITELYDKFFTGFEKWQREYDSIDPYYHMYDDSKSYNAGRDHKEYVNTLYKKLSGSDKKKADKHIEDAYNIKNKNRK